MSDDLKTFEGVLRKIHNDKFDLMVSKQKAYGKSNISKFGIYGVMVRLSDKIERLQNIIDNGGTETDDESLRDTLMDIGNYGDIALMVHDDMWGMPLEEDAVRESRFVVRDSSNALRQFQSTSTVPENGIPTCYDE